jgi:proteasome lid subunit RPN8/RPN11
VNAIRLSKAQLRAMTDAARAAAPEEACGLLLGTDDGAVRQVFPARNIAADPRTVYTVAPDDLIGAMTLADARGWTLVGIYHSHPEGEPIPSAVDIQHAHYPDTAYVIIGLAGDAPRAAAWRIARGAVVPVALQVGDRPPNFEADPPPNALQKRAIIAAAVVAVVIVLVVARALLPPAPPIP